MKEDNAAERLEKFIGEYLNNNQEREGVHYSDLFWWNERSITLSHEIRKRIEREAPPEEKERHRTIREQVEQELPELRQWARAAAARHQERVAVGTVLTGEETKVAQAMDNYAAEHSLAGRSAVVREALAQLLRIELARK